MTTNFSTLVCHLIDADPTTEFATYVPHFMSQARFSTLVYEKAGESGAPLLESVLLVCAAHQIDVEGIKSLLTKVLKVDLSREAEKLNLLKKPLGRRSILLPIQ